MILGYLSSIKTLASIQTSDTDGNPVFGASLAENIKIDGDNYSVTFKGSNYTYKTTKTALEAEINDKDAAGKGHSSGDADVVLLELALKDFYAKSTATFAGNPAAEGSAANALALLTGSLTKSISVTATPLGDPNSMDQSGTLLSFFSENGSAPMIAKSLATTSATVLAKMKALGLVAGKSYSFKEIDTMMDPSVTLISPSDTSKTIKISMANFKAYFSSIDYVYVDNWQNPGKTLITTNAAGNLVGGAGNDIIKGGNGNDTLDGGIGNDTILAGAGNNLVYGGSGEDSITCGAGNDTIDGGDGSNFIDAGAGNDSISGDGTIYGGLGNDTIKGNGNLYGGDGNDSITGSGSLAGGAGNDTIASGAYSDSRSSSSTLSGGAGNDVYYVGGNDVVSETVLDKYGKQVDAGGYDVVYTNDTSVDASKFTGIEKIYLTGGTSDYRVVAKGSASNDYFVGGDGNDSIDGGDGDDTLDGGLGTNYLIGGNGTNTYIVHRTFDPLSAENDFIINTSKTDILMADCSYTLDKDSTIINLSLAGTAVSATGNAKNNVITGNASDNKLYGMGGSDTLYGGAGNDTLDGGVTSFYDQYNREGTMGVDSLVGGAGNDTYIIDHIYNGWEDSSIPDDYSIVDETYSVIKKVATVVNKKTVYVDKTYTYDSGGIDTVIASVNNYTLGAYVENLTITGEHKDSDGNYTDNLNGNGNELKNTLKGNIGNNYLSGKAGNDTIYGGGGNDTLDGGTGADSLSGGAGNDTYVIDNTGDKINLTAETGGTDTVMSSISYILGTGLDNLTLTGTAALSATGNSLDNVIKAHQLAATAKYGDTLIGGAGNDTYYVYNGKDGVSKDIVTETTTATDPKTKKVTTKDSGGIDTVVSSFSYVLGTNLENLTLEGVIKNTNGQYIDMLNATGNALNNVINGNYGINTIDGGKGNDTLQGGDSGDIYKFRSGDGNDTVTDTSASFGTDVPTQDKDGNYYSNSNAYNIVDASITRSDILFYNDKDGNIVFDYTKGTGVGNDSITFTKGSAGTINLSDGHNISLEFMNQIIQQIGAYAVLKVVLT